MTKTQSAQSTQSQASPLVVKVTGIQGDDEEAYVQVDTKDIPATQVAQGWGVETRSKVERLQAELYSLTLRVEALQSKVQALTQERDDQEAEAQERTRAEHQERMDLGI